MAIREFQLQGRDVADYLLYAGGKAIGVVFVKVRSITAKIRNDRSTKLGKTGGDRLIILAANFDVLEFVLLDKLTWQRQCHSFVTPLLHRSNLVSTGWRSDRSPGKASKRLV